MSFFDMIRTQKGKVILRVCLFIPFFLLASLIPLSFYFNMTNPDSHDSKVIQFIRDYIIFLYFIVIVLLFYSLAIIFYIDSKSFKESELSNQKRFKLFFSHFEQIRYFHKYVDNSKTKNSTK